MLAFNAPVAKAAGAARGEAVKAQTAGCGKPKPSRTPTQRPAAPYGPAADATTRARKARIRREQVF